MTKFWTGLNQSIADHKLNAIEKLKFVLGKVENMVGKGENAGFQHFLLFPQCFQKASFLGVVKNPDCVVKGLTRSHTTTPFDAPGKQAF